MSLVPDWYTAEMVRAQPADGNRYEVVIARHEADVGEWCVHLVIEIAALSA